MINTFESELMEINSSIKDRYNNIFKMSNEQFHSEILEKSGRIVKLQKLEKDEILNAGLIVGVDGSTNRVGGAFPHYIDFFKALAKPTRGDNIFIEKIYSPVINEEEVSKEVILSETELDAAMEAIDKIKPQIIMMDGGLIRYQINNRDKYNELQEKCISENIILFGVIKDIKTNIIARNFGMSSGIFDREVLYGRLNTGEGLIIHNSINNKYHDGNVVSAFLRTSNSAWAIGIDILEAQSRHIEDMANLVYTLTPENSRGVPIWLDIVDKEVKITDSYIKMSLEEFLDRDIYEKFFVSERDRRTL